MALPDDAPVRALSVRTATVPTDAPESDGTFAWDATTIVLVEIEAGGHTGIGWTYGDQACAAVVAGTLKPCVIGRSALDVPGIWSAMSVAVRNSGQVGITAMAISAVDLALWDLKARLLGVPLVSLLGRVREAAPVYGSGGFCSYDDERLAEQLAGWVQEGIGRVKMKVGRDGDRDRERVRVAREAIGEAAELYVDANGAYHRAEAVGWAGTYAEHFGVTWFEEPVSSDDRAGLGFVRDRAPSGMAIAAGEYGYDLAYFRDLVEAVDVVQADVTRCGGITRFLAVAALCEAHGVPLSAHCAPNLSAHPCCAAPAAVHIEYFHDHVRLEAMLFDGVLVPEHGALRPDLSRNGHGMELKLATFEQYAT